MKIKTHYDVLEVSRKAEHAEIKSAYRRLTTLWHPDKHFGDVAVGEKYKEIVLAYEVLSDPDKRMAYDLGFRVNGSFDPSDLSAELIDPEKFLKTVQDLFGKYLDDKLPGRFDPKRKATKKEDPGPTPKKCRACGGKRMCKLQQGSVVIHVACSECAATGVGRG